MKKCWLSLLLMAVVILFPHVRMTIKMYIKMTNMEKVERLKLLSMVILSAHIVKVEEHIMPKLKRIY